MRKRFIILSGIAAIALTLGAVSAPAFAADTAVATKASELLFSGVWTKKSFKSSGTWEIFSEGDKTFVKLSADFKTRKAPDLKIFLSPLAAKDTNGRNAANGSVLIAPLTSRSGEQIYEIPEGIDFADFKSILIHCEAYAKLWSAADLR
ncbi:MAG: DM13 domain-containing protein [Alphaproteobacteria bacterium]|nr:DM13 domain-containing protein [Alphaproteobacteria bacterium]